MKNLVFRKLNPDEIQCRVAMTKQNGCQILLYKDARVDMKLLDEVVGPYNWQNDYREIKGVMYAGIGIRDEKDSWIWKWDAGVESNMEAEKGESSDSFKRAGFRWGIGRELYTSPFVWVPAEKTKIQQVDGKLKVNDSFSVAEIGYDDDGHINRLVIKNRAGSAVFVKGSAKAAKAEAPPAESKKEEAAPKAEKKLTPKQEKLSALKDQCRKDNVSMVLLAKCYKKSKVDDLTIEFINNAMEHWDQVKEKCTADPNEIPS